MWEIEVKFKNRDGVIRKIKTSGRSKYEMLKVLSDINAIELLIDSTLIDVHAKLKEEL